MNEPSPQPIDADREPTEPDREPTEIATEAGFSDDDDPAEELTAHRDADESSQEDVREQARRDRLRSKIFSAGDAAAREEERRREQELLGDVPPHHG